MEEEKMVQYLTYDEKMQLEALMRRAEKRREEQGRNDGESGNFLNLRFVIEFGIGEKSKGQKDGRIGAETRSPHDDAEELCDFQKLFLEMCSFCKKYDMELVCRERKEENEEELFDLPL